MAGPRWDPLAGEREPAHLRDCSQSPGDSEKAEGVCKEDGDRVTWALAGETEVPSIG